MDPVIEFRTYRAKPGTRDALLDILRQEAFPMQRQLGMRILGPFPSSEDEVTFVWLRGFPSEESREPLTSAFYDCTAWLEDLGPRVLPMLDGYSAIVVSDTGDLWSHWPSDHDQMSAGHPPPSSAFALTTVHGPSWDNSLSTRTQRGWTDHAAFMDVLVELGFILVGGPLDDGAETLHVVAADSEQQVRERMAEDPWARDGLLQVASIRPWALWLDFRHATPDQPA